MELLRWIGHWVLFFFASIILFHYCHRYTVPSRAPLENEGQTFLLLGSVACGQCLAVKNCHPGSSLAIQWLGLTQQFHWGSIPGEGTKDPASCVQFSSVQFSSVAQLCLTICDPMDWSMSGFPVHHQLPELAQTHVHWVGDAIQPSHPLLSLSPPAFNPAQHQGLFYWDSSSHQVAKVLEFQLQH